MTRALLALAGDAAESLALAALLAAIACGYFAATPDRPAFAPAFSTPALLASR